MQVAESGYNLAEKCLQNKPCRSSQEEADFNRRTFFSGKVGVI